MTPRRAGKRRAANYLLTGGTGFIGRFLVPRLLARGARVYLVVRPQSLYKIEELRALWGADESRVVALEGDLERSRLGLGSAVIRQLKGHVDHFVHLGAIYDLEADADAQIRANVDGTRNALACARAVQAGCFHHVSSIAAAGLFEGTFDEEMFEQATGLDHPYYRSKHDAEGIVRKSRRMRWRIYRPGIVVGHSRTGEMHKIDGPYYFFGPIRRISRSLPRWLHAVIHGGGVLNIVPVDYVAAAMDHLMHLRAQDGRTFFLTHETGIRVGELLQLLLRVSRGPELHLSDDPASAALLNRLANIRPDSSRALDAVIAPLLEKQGIPLETLRFINYPTRFDSSRTRRLLSRAGISCPDLEHYAPVLWDYWERHLANGAGRQHDDGNGSEPLWPFRRANSKRLRRAVSGRVVLVTGASSGIGKACALRLGEAGATVLVAARGREQLQDVVAEIREGGGECHSYVCDLAQFDDCDKLVESVLLDHGRLDILVNNAGRSIRRSVQGSFRRFHDFERTMQLNYFGALRLILGFAPGMLERRSGHFVNISSIGVLANPPRFAAYVASKAALDAFSWCAAAEFADRNVRFTTVNMPLVRTPMIAPTRIYDAVPTLTPEQAADLVMKAIVDQPRRVTTGLGKVAALTQAALPGFKEFVLNQAYHLFPDSPAAQGDRDGMRREKQEAASQGSMELARRLFSQVFSGVHW